MQGQEILTNILNQFTLDTLPHAMLFQGPYGCGKHTLITEICTNLGITVEFIQEPINLVLLEKLTAVITPTIYVIDNDTISQKETTILLKFIEEPQAKIFIAIITRTLATVSPTILNRCQKYSFLPYSNDFLHSLATTEQSDLFFNIADTPGKILNWQNEPLLSMYEFAEKIILNIHKTTYGNLFTIINRLDFNNKSVTSKKYNFDIFIEVFYKCIYNYTLIDISMLNIFNLTKELLQSLTIPYINKQILFENYLFKFKLLKK